MGGFDKILKAADIISDVRKAFEKIKTLEDGQKQIVDALSALDKRVRELEAGLREAKSDIRLEALRETQHAVNSVQGTIYEKIVDLSVRVDRLSSSIPTETTNGAPTPALPRPKPSIGQSENDQ